MTRVAVIVEDPGWQDAGAGLARNLRRAARTTLAETKKRGDLTILLAGDERLKALNARFRGKPRPTNVLSFPAVGGTYLGDVAITFGVTSREARAAGKSIHDHALHLAVHGVLHLLGYDHETAREARIMEPLEIAILAKLGVADPYSARPRAASAD